MDQSQVVITVPRAKKGAWVAVSRAQGRKLTDWLIERIDAPDAFAPDRLNLDQFCSLAALMRLGDEFLGARGHVEQRAPGGKVTGHDRASEPGTTPRGREAA